MRGNLHGTLDRSGTLDRHAARDLLFNFLSRRADQQCKNGPLAQRFLQQRVITAFVFSAQNDQDSPGKGFQRLQRGIDVGGFRIVVIADASDFRDKFEAMLNARERADSARDGRRLGPCQARGRHRRQHIFNVVGAR